MDSDKRPMTILICIRIIQDYDILKLISLILMTDKIKDPISNNQRILSTILISES